MDKLDSLPQKFTAQPLQLPDIQTLTIADNARDLDVVSSQNKLKVNDSSVVMQAAQIKTLDAYTITPSVPSMINSCESTIQHVVINPTIAKNITDANNQESSASASCLPHYASVKNWRLHKQLVCSNTYQAINHFTSLTQLKEKEIIKLPPYEDMLMIYQDQFKNKYLIKFLRQSARKKANDTNFISLKKGEISALKVSDHPNIAKTFACLLMANNSCIDQRSFMLINSVKQLSAEYIEKYSVCAVIEEYCDNSLDLNDLIDRQQESLKALTSQQIVDFSLQIANALAHIHDCNVMHRDIKPANIMVNTQTGQIKIIDFGLSKPLEKFDATSTSCGTLHTVAPELYDLSPSYSYSADLWSLGVTIGCLLYSDLVYKLHSPNTFQFNDIVSMIKAYAQASDADKQTYLSRYCKYDTRNINPKLIKLIIGLTKKDPAARMTIDKTVEALQKIQLSLK